MREYLKRFKLTPLTIALVYYFCGVLWIVVTTFLPGFFFPNDSHLLSEMDQMGRWVFIVLTACMIYFLVGQSEAAIKRRKESLSAVNRALKCYSACNQALIRATDEYQLMCEICRICVDVGGYRVAWVGFADEDREKSIRPVAQWGDEKGYLTNLKASWAEIDRGRGPTGTAIRTRMPVVVQQIMYDPMWELWRDEALKHGFAASISLPLIASDRAFGALVIFAGKPGAFDNREVKLLHELSGDLSYGIMSLRARTERNTAESERKLLASVIQQSNEGIILVDGSGIVSYANPAIEAILGHSAGMMVGKTLAEQDPGGMNRAFYQALWENMQKGWPNTRHLFLLGKEDARTELDCAFWTVSDIDGSARRHVVLIRDATTEAKLERQLRQAQRMESLATLAGGIAHDFNNNLASIITCAELAREDLPDSAPQAELLDVILKSGYRGRNLVKQIMTFCRRDEQERQPVKVEVIVQECLNLLRASLPSTIEIRQQICEQPGMVLADPTQIHQIIMNLCTNAAHAMLNRKGVLELTLKNVEIDSDEATHLHGVSPGSHLQLTVRDTGHGMDRQTLERIFDPFFSTKKPAEGTGLGLSVVHGIVKGYRGVITVDSEPGLGSTFQVQLPCIDAAEARLEPSLEAGLGRGGERILFVDDEEDVVFAGRKMLERLGYRVIAAKDSLEALETFRTQPDQFDLVITDQTMPHMTGTDLAKEIASIRRDIPVVLCTGALAGRGDDGSPLFETPEFIQEIAYKPLDRSEMSAVIRRALARPC
jgi:PAS domain S-box-containing protein